MKAFEPHQAISRWFAEKSWQPLPFQTQVWCAMREGESGLLHATTGAGKTLAVGFGAWQALTPNSGLTLLWITPMRALAADTALALSEAFARLHELDPSAPLWTTGVRTGDTSPKDRAAQSRHPPNLLITTPESLSLMLSQPDAHQRLGRLGAIVVDEWHELLGNKRGVQVQLALARLRRWNPKLLVWGMSATIGNLAEAKRVLLGSGHQPGQHGTLVSAQLKKTIVVDTLIPQVVERFPWAGHLGLTMLPQVIAEIDASANSLIFTNTRAQSEIWYHNLLKARPDWAGMIAVHHGSLANESRQWVEQGLKSGALKAVVCTSSLDLGVDFLPVERVLQIGSPKGIARLLQRAGRSGHAPGRASRITLVPSHSLELVESAALQMAISRGEIEGKSSPKAPLDVLVQHLVTIGLGGGFEPDDLRAEISNTAAYQGISDADWQFCLDFVRQGGATLRAYPDFRRCAPDKSGIWRVTDRALATRHRQNIGTITSDSSMMVQFGPAPPGAKLGSVEESFIARLKPGDRFWFAGRLVSLVQVRDMTAYVRKAKGSQASVPRWGGGRMPLSTTLANAMVEQLALAADGVYQTPELRAAKPMLELQLQRSALPTPSTLLVETLTSREGWHVFVYPFAGRNVHLGLASLLSWRAAQTTSGTFSLAINDYGFEILSASERNWGDEIRGLVAPRGGQTLGEQVRLSVNATELARRRFRDIARISGLVQSSYAGERKSARQIQASSGLYYDVFAKYDPDNGLLVQAQNELLHEELDIDLIDATLRDMNEKHMVLKALARCSPLAFPLMVERLREKLTNESLHERVERMAAALEKDELQKDIPI